MSLSKRPRQDISSMELQHVTPAESNPYQSAMARVLQLPDKTPHQKVMLCHRLQDWVRGRGPYDGKKIRGRVIRSPDPDKAGFIAPDLKMDDIFDRSTWGPQGERDKWLSIKKMVAETALYTSRYITLGGYPKGTTEEQASTHPWGNPTIWSSFPGNTGGSREGVARKITTQTYIRTPWDIADGTARGPDMSFPDFGTRRGNMRAALACFGTGCQASEVITGPCGLTLTIGGAYIKGHPIDQAAVYPRIVLGTWGLLSEVAIESASNGKVARLWVYDPAEPRGGKVEEVPLPKITVNGCIMLASIA